MEVHHHPHVEKKSLKDFLLEGFMIFIAVTLGFLAESLRESIYNNERRSEYISSLIENLEQDEISLNRTISNNQKKIAGLDSLLSLTSKNMASPVTRGLLYTYCQRYATYHSGFSVNDATMMQLKNAGGLHFIKDHRLADSIASYDVVVRELNAAEVPYGKAIDNTLDAMSELLVLRNRYDTAYFMNGVYKGKKLPLLVHDQNKLEIFFNKIVIEREWTRNYVNNLEATLPFAKRLIELLKKKL